MQLENIVGLISLLAGIAGMPIIEFIKRQAQISGQHATILAVCVSLAIGIGVSVASGQLAADLTGLEAVGQAFAVVYATSNVVYKALLSDKSK